VTGRTRAGDVVYRTSQLENLVITRKGTVHVVEEFDDEIVNNKAFVKIERDQPGRKDLGE